MPFAYLDAAQLGELRAAAAEAGFAEPAMRDALLDSLYPPFRSTLKVIATPSLQLRSDLRACNEMERLVDGSVPLEAWLRNAVELALAQGPAEVFQLYLDQVAAAAAGEPEPPPAEELGELDEVIVHRDDTLPYGFLAEGVFAGRAVAHLRVHPFAGEKKQTSPFLGTGWLITRDLIVTNHHVIHARSKSEPPASDDELARQAQATEAYFDYLDRDQLGALVRCRQLVAADRRLDYAILRLEQKVERKPLRLAVEPVVVDEGRHVPVNILQHPQGGPKKVALRNNLLSGANQQELRYFTDTRPGSSGAPVLNDSWQVVGLHRGARLISGVKFQGKTTAYVNFGTQLPSILEHLREADPAAAAELLQSSA